MAEPVDVAPGLAARSRKGVSFGFAGTVMLGLALSGWYLSSRIVTADATPVTATPAFVGPVALPVPAEDLIPLPPQLYLELPALGTNDDLQYVNQLHSKGFPAFVEASASNPVGCILVGPFDGVRERMLVKRRLKANGALAVETTR